MRKLFMPLTFLSRKSAPALAALLFFITISSKGQDLQKLIPANATGVFTVDGGSFFKKIDLAQINRLDMFQEIDERNKGKKGARYKEYSKIYKEPQSIGLNLNSRSYIFYEITKDTGMWGIPHTYTALVTPLSSGKKFESFIKKITDSSIVKGKEYKYIKTGFGTLVGWNKSQAIILSVNSWSEDAGSLVIKKFNDLTKQKAENSIKSNANFQEAQAGTFDFHYWMNFESYFNGLMISNILDFQIFRNIPYIGSNFYKGYYLRSAMNFENGSINIQSRQYLNEESVKQVNKLYGKGINPDFMKYVQKDNLLGAYAYSFNMKELTAILDTALHDTIKDKMNQGFVSFLYEKKIKDDPSVSKMQKQLDSMYTDLYPVDTTAYDYNYDYYSTDSTYIDGYYEQDSIENTEEINEEPAVVEDYNYDAYPVDTTYSYNYNNYGYDSIYSQKNERIDLKRKEIEERKKILTDKKVTELGIKGNDLLELFSGEIFAAITDLYHTEKKYTTYEYDEEEYKMKEVEKTKKDFTPEYIVILGLNNVEKTKNLMTKLEKDSFIVKQGKGSYYLIKESEHKILVAISGSMLIVTNDENLLKEQINGYAPNERASQEVQNILLNKPSSLYVNLKEIFARVPVEDKYKDKAINELLVNSFQYLKLTSDVYKGNVSNSDFSFYFTNKIDNSFYEIFRIINEVYKIEKNNR